MLFDNFGYRIEIETSSVSLAPGKKGQHLGSNTEWIKVNKEDWVCLKDIGTRHSWEWRKLLETIECKEDAEAFVSLFEEEYKRWKLNE